MNALVAFLNVYAYLAELCRDRLKVFRDNICDNNVALCGSRRYHISACLYLVRDSRIGNAFEVINASYLDNVCTCASDISTH